MTTNILRKTYFVYCVNNGILCDNWHIINHILKALQKMRLNYILLKSQTILLLFLKDCDDENLINKIYHYRIYYIFRQAFAIPISLARWRKIVITFAVPCGLQLKQYIRLVPYFNVSNVSPHNLHYLVIRHLSFRQSSATTN